MIKEVEILVIGGGPAGLCAAAAAASMGAEVLLCERDGAPGGQLVYSTCSIELEENGLQVERFLSGHPEFRKVSSRQILPSVEADGAYACLLRRA